MTLSKGVENRVITGIASGNDAWLQSKQMPMEKSKVFLDTNPVTIDDEDFNQWVGNCLGITLGPRPSTSAAPAAGIPGNQQAMDYLALSKMLATTIGSNMMQFSRAITLTGGGGAGSTGGETALAIRK